MAQSQLAENALIKPYLDFAEWSEAQIEEMNRLGMDLVELQKKSTVEHSYMC